MNDNELLDKERMELITEKAREVEKDIRGFDGSVDPNIEELSTYDVHDLIAALKEARQEVTLPAFDEVVLKSERGEDLTIIEDFIEEFTPGGENMENIFRSLLRKIANGQGNEIDSRSEQAVGDREGCHS